MRHALDGAGGPAGADLGIVRNRLKTHLDLQCHRILNTVKQGAEVNYLGPSQLTTSVVNELT